MVGDLAQHPGRAVHAESGVADLEHRTVFAGALDELVILRSIGGERFQEVLERDPLGDASLFLAPGADVGARPLGSVTGRTIVSGGQAARPLSDVWISGSNSAALSSSLGGI